MWTINIFSNFQLPKISCTLSLAFVFCTLIPHFVHYRIFDTLKTISRVACTTPFIFFFFEGRSRASYGLTRPDFFIIFPLENSHYRKNWYIEYNHVLLILISQCNWWRNITFNGNCIFTLRNTPVLQLGISILNRTHYCYAWKHCVLNS